MRLVARQFDVHVTDVELVTSSNRAAPAAACDQHDRHFRFGSAKVKRHFDHFTQQSGRMDYSQFYGLEIAYMSVLELSKCMQRISAILSEPVRPLGSTNFWLFC